MLSLIWKLFQAHRHTDLLHILLLNEKSKADRQTGDFPGGVVIGMHLLTSFENICLYLHYQLSNKEKHKI